MAKKKQPPDRPWSPGTATTKLRDLAIEDLQVCLSDHVKERMLERGLIIGDILHVLGRGFVYDVPEKTTRGGDYKYAMESPTPNSGGRTVRVVVIPYPSATVKVVTIMWADEPITKK